MTIARITQTHPTSDQLPGLSATKPTAFDNSQPCSGAAVRALEDSTVYITTRCKMSMGGGCRITNLSTGDSPANLRQRLALEPYTETVNFYIGVSSSGAGNSVAIPFGGTSVSIRKTQDYTSFDQVQHIVAPITVGSGDKTDLGTADIAVTVTIAAGIVRVWYAGPEPVQLNPGNVTVS